MQGETVASLVAGVDWEGRLNQMSGSMQIQQVVFAVVAASVLLFLLFTGVLWTLAQVAGSVLFAVATVLVDLVGWALEFGMSLL